MRVNQFRAACEDMGSIAITDKIVRRDQARLFGRLPDRHIRPGLNIILNRGDTGNPTSTTRRIVTLGELNAQLVASGYKFTVVQLGSDEIT